MSDLSALETRMEYEEQKKIIDDLETRVMDAEVKLIEGEKLRKKLHNTILVYVYLLIYLFVVLFYILFLYQL